LARLDQRLVGTDLARIVGGGDVDHAAIRGEVQREEHIWRRIRPRDGSPHHGSPVT
jgi:hypothetical protein